MRTPYSCLPALLALAVALPAPAKPAKPSLAAQLQAQLKKVTQERDDLKERLAATESLQEDLAAAQKSRDLARQDAQAAHKALDQMKGTLAENTGSSDTILKDLQQAKDAAAAKEATIQSLRADLAKANERKVSETASEAVPITPDITPAKPMNLNKITPKTKGVNGVIVVNVLVSENGEVLDARLLQGLPGEGVNITKAHEACVDAAKRIVFDPARAADGTTKVRVWQGVGFKVD